jgi:hypothetical protein
MKLSKKIVALAILGSLTAVFAEATVDEQIEAIKNAPAQERVQLMNQFKVRLRSMNEADREQAISALRTQTQQQTRTQAQTQQQTKNMQEDSQLRQKNQVEQMNQVRTMNQWNSMGRPNSQGSGSGQNPVRIPMH